MTPYSLLFGALVCLAPIGQALADDVSVQAAIDDALNAMQSAAADAGVSEVVAIDHARLAAAEGVDMLPSRLLILTDPALNTAILQRNIRAGLDLPFRVLSFEQGGQPRVFYTDFAFLARRHKLDAAGIGAAFDGRMAEVLSATSLATSAAPTEALEEDYGILELEAAHDFATTVSRLRDAIMSQDDTVWFGEVDFTNEAATSGTTLPSATVLLFGGPGPGGVAMRDFPAIGLDAFCQKLLVYERTDGRVVVLYNDIAALADLHYGASAKPHHVLNTRLTETYTQAIK